MFTELNGMYFRKGVDGSYEVLDSSYSIKVGIIKLVEGPGWIIELDTTFLDHGQLITLVNFINALNRQLQEV